MEIKKVHSDNRGDIYNYTIGGRTYVIVSFEEKGIARGGHYHQTAQWHIALAGRMKLLLHDMKDGREEERFMSEGDSILIPQDMAHLFIAEEPSVVAESRIGEYEATDYEPYRKLARPQ